MKELIHLVSEDSKLNNQISYEISKFLELNNDTVYTEITKESPLFEYYSKKYSLSQYPVFIGLVDGKLQDGHIGIPTALMLGSLVN